LNNSYNLEAKIIIIIILSNRTVNKIK